jgi:hypothetical protein
MFDSKIIRYMSVIEIKINLHDYWDKNVSLYIDNIVFAFLSIKGYKFSALPSLNSGLSSEIMNQ